MVAHACGCGWHHVAAEARQNLARTARPHVAAERNARGSPPRGLDVDDDVPPLPLPEAKHTQAAAGDVSEQDGQPNVGGLEASRCLQDEAEAERQDDL